MPVIIKYNTDIAFRREVSLRRSFKSRNFKLRLGVEFALMVISVIAMVLLLGTEIGRSMPVVLFYLDLIIGIFTTVHIIKALIKALRIKPGDEMNTDREFYFDEIGFSFGPLDSDGTMIGTKWSEFDAVYLTENVMYILCMHKRHWAAVDSALMVDGSWEELVELVRAHVEPKKMLTAK